MPRTTVEPEPVEHSPDDEQSFVADLAIMDANANCAIQTWEAMMKDAAAEHDPHRLAVVLGKVKRATDELALAYRDGRRWARPLIPDRTSGFAVQGVLLTKDYGRDRSEWSHEQLLANVLPGIVADALGTDAAGAAYPLFAEHLDAMAAEVAKALVPLLLAVLTPDWKVGTGGKPMKVNEGTGEIIDPGQPASGLRARGITPSDYCVEKSANTVTVKLVGS